MIKILLVSIMAIFMLTGCSGCIGIPGIFKKGGSSNVELSTPEAIKTAVVVPLFGEISEKWAIDVEKALKNSQYDLVVLWIESPGGGVAETQLLLRKLKVYQKKYDKPIYVYSERILASGAYWIASAFEKIVISPAGYAGSIGVYMVRADYTKLYDMLGIKYYYIVSDSTKAMGNSATPMEDWEREYWQWSVNSVHAAFMNHVWAYRLPQLISAYELRNLVDVKTRQDTVLAAEQFRQIANGILYNSEYATFAGLIDSVMYFDEFMNVLQLDGYTTVTIEGEIITEFYPFSSKEDSKKEARQEVWNHLK